MTAENTKGNWLGSNLALGLLVTLLSVFTALTNYSTYKAGNEASDLKAEGDRQLANSNTEYISASQFIIVDYNMYDNYYVNVDVDNAKAEYYQSQFSDDLTASVGRDDPFDDQYYTAMYKDAEDLFNEAFATFDRAQVLDDQEGGFQFAMLIAAVGLSFAAYASLLEETNRLRSVFAALSIVAFVLGIIQYVIVMRG